MISLLWLCGLNHFFREFKRRSDFSLCNELFLKILINVPRARHACFSFLPKANIPVNENIDHIRFKIKVSMAGIHSCMKQQSLNLTYIKSSKIQYQYLYDLCQDKDFLQPQQMPRKDGWKSIVYVTRITGDWTL